MNWLRKAIDTIKTWRIGDYVRQFSIVAAGVMVTFWGSNMISGHSTQKEIEASMQLIIQELEKNKDELLLMKDRYETDRKMADYLIDSSFVISKFPLDTLRKYNRLISNISAFFYSDYALEVLKNSNLMQKIEDKELLMSIIEAYESLRETQESLKEYYTMKSSIIVDISLNNDILDGYGSIAPTWTKIFANNSMRSFCGIANRFFNYDYFDDKQAELNDLITRLRERYQ